MIVASGTSGARAINAAGQTAGVVTSPAGGTMAAYSSGGPLQPVTLPSGATSGIATGIGGGGDVAGYYTGKDGNLHGFYTSGGSASTIAPLMVNGGSGTFTKANGMSSAGVIVGTGDLPSGANRAFYSTGGGSPTIINPLGTGSFTEGNGINDKGMVVGTSETSPGGLEHAFYTNATSTAIDLLGSRNTAGNFLSNTYGLAIDHAGDVVGKGDLGGTEHAFFAPNTGGPLDDLGVLAGATSSIAEAINSQALVVGQSGSRGFLWGASAGLYDLNTLILPAQQLNWSIQDATGINDSDQICGVGLFHGVAHGFILTPIPGQSIFAPANSVPAPPALLLSALGLGIASGWSRRGRARSVV